MITERTPSGGNAQPVSLVASLFLLALAAVPLQAGNRETATVESADEVLRIFSAGRLKGIPHALVGEARGIAVIPHVVKAGLLVDRRFGRGVLLVREANGTWSQPLFLTLEGGGVGLEAGVEATDLVLVFRTQASLDRILKDKGKLTLGSDAAVAAGPLGQEAELVLDVRRKAEVYAYSHNRGLFAGLALEGDHLQIDRAANEAFYHVRGGHPTEVLALRKLQPVASVERLRSHLVEMCGPPAPPVSAPPGKRR